jgi:transcription initiation factor TFIIB
MKIPEDTKEKALELFSEAKEKHLVRGRGAETIANACLYIACRIHKKPWMIKNIAEESKVSAKNIRKASKALLQKLEIKLSPIDPSVFIDKFCADLKLSDKAETNAIKIIEKAEKANLTNGPSPEGIAAAAIYIAAILSGERRAQWKVSDIAGVTEVTIRSRYKEIAKELGIDMSS